MIGWPAEAVWLGGQAALESLNAWRRGPDSWLSILPSELWGLVLRHCTSLKCSSDT